MIRGRCIATAEASNASACHGVNISTDKSLVNISRAPVIPKEPGEFVQCFIHTNLKVAHKDFALVGPSSKLIAFINGLLVIKAIEFDHEWDLFPLGIHRPKTNQLERHGPWNTELHYGRAKRWGSHSVGFFGKETVTDEYFRNSLAFLNGYQFINYSALLFRMPSPKVTYLLGCSSKLICT